MVRHRREGTECPRGGNGVPPSRVEGRHRGRIRIRQSLRTEHADERLIKRAARRRPCRLHLDNGVALARRPDRFLRTFRQKPCLCFKTAGVGQRHRKFPRFGTNLFHGKVEPVVARTRQTGFDRVDDFPAALGGTAGIGAKKGLSGGWRALQREGNRFPGQPEHAASRFRVLPHDSLHDHR